MATGSIGPVQICTICKQRILQASIFPLRAFSRRSLSGLKVLVQSNRHSPVRGPRHRCTSFYTWWTIARVKDFRGLLSGPILPLVNTALHKSGFSTTGEGSTSYTHYWKNTYLTESRALEDYLLEPCDLEGLEVHYIRSAYSGTGKREKGFMKLDVEQRALNKWGTWTDLKRELEKRREIEEEVERRRKGFSAIIAHLKSSQKQLNRKEVDDEAYGGHDTRKSILRGSATVVGYAIVSNFVVMLMKWVAYVHTGSAAMLSETIHSLVDMLNQCLLAIGIISSIQQPDPDHPYGFSRARYVYSLISGVGFFFLGAGVTMYHGIMALLTPPILESMPVAFSVLGGSFLVEGLTLLAAIRQVRRSARHSGVTFKDYVLRGKDPSAVAVLMEDSAAVTGVLIASASILMTHFTGNHVYDAIGSITIGGLLGAVALFLIQRNSDALVGRTMHSQRLKEIVELLESDQVIHSVHDVKATDMGADSVRFKAEINIDGREVTRVHLSRLDMEAILKEVQSIKTVNELEKFLLEHGEHVVDKIGDEIDRVEIKIKKHSPDVRHIDLEII